MTEITAPGIYDISDDAYQNDRKSKRVDKVTAPSPRRYRQKRDAGRSDAHRAFIRKHECVLWGNPITACDTDHAIEAAHYRSAANSGTGMKPGDEFLLPLCRAHHSLQHAIGQKAFEERYGISMRDKALGYAVVSPDQELKARARKLMGMVDA